MSSLNKLFVLVALALAITTVHAAPGKLVNVYLGVWLIFCPTS
jgi:hypothetical protein